MVFIVDDNFISNGALHALIEWRRRTRTRIGFLTEASMNLADDPELCSLMSRPGQKVFVGSESPRSRRWRIHKLQTGIAPLVARCNAGNAPAGSHGGDSCGFRQRTRATIFKRQFEFIQRSGVATAMVGLLTALPQTRLWQRLKREGRLEVESSGNNSTPR